MTKKSKKKRLVVRLMNVIFAVVPLPFQDLKNICERLGTADKPKSLRLYNVG